MSKAIGRYLSEQLFLKITLLGSQPAIWRRVEVHSGLTLHGLHYVIQCVFDWDDDHLFQFLVPPDGKLTQRAMRDAKRYHVQPPDPFFDIFKQGEKDYPADQTLIGQVFSDKQKQIVYEYDFGDSWMHLVKLEKRTPDGNQDHIPVCLAGDQAAPRDDMGGIGGYYDWLYSLSHKNAELHEEAVEWLGEDFDPAHFDLDLVNKRLNGVFRPAPKKPRKGPKDQD